jgi:glycosyltransferase involved in cell wall biosynthesis
VDCALSQTVADKEIIVVDDASEDGSREILQQYGNAIRLIEVRQNVGANKARNLGAAAAVADYLVFLDGDDAFMPWALDVYNRIIDLKNPKIILSNLRFFWGALAAVEKQDAPCRIEVVDYALYLNKDRRYQACASTIIIDRQLFNGVQGWSEDIFPLDDIDLITKLCCAGRAVQVLSPATVFYRLHANNSVRQVPPFMDMAHRIICKARRGEYPGGPQRRFAVYAFVGGPTAFWVKRAFRAGLYQQAWKLMIAGRSVIFAAVARRWTMLIKGRQPMEVIDLAGS